jgi:hypothetical protein
VPVTLPYIEIKFDNVMPEPMLLNPAIGVVTFKVKSLDEAIAITTSFTVNNIAGTNVPNESVNSVDLALVTPNPSVASGPIKLQVAPFQTYRTPTGVLYQKDPTAGVSGAMSAEVADPILSQRSPLYALSTLEALLYQV